MKAVTQFQIDTTLCDVALREGVQSKVHSAVWMTLVIDMLSREIIGGESHMSPLDQKAFKRLLRYLGTRHHPNNRRSS